MVWPGGTAATRSSRVMASIAIRASPVLLVLAMTVRFSRKLLMNSEPSVMSTTDASIMAIRVSARLSPLSRS